MTQPFLNFEKAIYLAEIITNKDPLLTPYQKIIANRLHKCMITEQRLTQDKIDLKDFASGHEFFGLHFKDGHWIFREWAPNADAIYLIGETTGWRELPEYRLQPAEPKGVWEIRLPADTFYHRMLYRLRIHWPGGDGDRIPAYARR